MIKKKEGNKLCGNGDRAENCQIMIKNHRAENWQIMIKTQCPFLGIFVQKLFFM